MRPKTLFYFLVAYAFYLLYTVFPAAQMIVDLGDVRAETAQVVYHYNR